MSKPKTHNYFEGLAWDKVDWKVSFNRVRRMQKRIYKASRNGDKGKLVFLQKLLLRNPHAKLTSVYTVTTLNKGRRAAGIDRRVMNSSKQKLELAKSLAINGKADPVRRSWIPLQAKPPARPSRVARALRARLKIARAGRVTRKRPLGISTIRDRAKQALCKTVLEPQWEAKFEPNSYGFRPGRSAHDAIEAVFLNLHHREDKYVFHADIRKCFDQINHETLLKKLDTFPLMESQVYAWLKAGVFDQYAAASDEVSAPGTVTKGVPQGGVISPLLANIALHGLEEQLLEFVAQRKMPKPHPQASKGTKTKKAALGFVRYADDFLLIHRDLEILRLVIDVTKNWLAGIGLSLSEEKSSLKKASQTFKFLGFQIALIRSRSSTGFRVYITPSKESVLQLFSKVRAIIQHNKAASAFQLIQKIRPVILGWGNYFQYCECKKTFWKVDNVIFQQIRAWVFRRAVRQGRRKVKENYFPSGNTNRFQGRSYRADWILTGSKKIADSQGHKISTILPKLSWIKRKKFVKVKGDASVYNGDEVYWAFRNSRYSILSTRVKNLLQKQKGRCPICKGTFKSGDLMEVDHIVPKLKGGQDTYSNLQLLHRHCHVTKTRHDRAKPRESRDRRSRG